MKNILSCLILTSLFFACGDAAQTHEESTKNHDQSSEMQHPEEEHSEDEVGLSTLQMEKIGLEMGTFEQKNLKSSIKVNGQLALPPQNRADVSSMAAGRIIKINVVPGQAVKKGSILASLQNPNFIEWQQSFLETKGELLYLEKEKVRLEDLVKKEIAPQRQLDKILSESAIAHAKLKGVQSRLKLLGIDEPAGDELASTIYLRSPLNGFIKEIKANTGVFVQPEQSLFEVVDNHHLHIDLKVFEKDLPFLKNGQTIQFSLQSKPNELMDAHIFAIGKSLNEEDKTVDVHAEIKKTTTQLLPGMFVEARILLDDKKVNALPDEAVTTDKGLSYIFVKEEVHEEETHFMKIPVLTGKSDFGYTEIIPLEELPEDAQIVTKGAYFLMAQTKKGEEGGGHHH